MFTAHISQTSPVCLYIGLTDFSLLQNSPSFLLHHVTVSNQLIINKQKKKKSAYTKKKLLQLKWIFILKSRILWALYHQQEAFSILSQAIFFYFEKVVKSVTLVLLCLSLCIGEMLSVKTSAICPSSVVPLIGQQFNVPTGWFNYMSTHEGDKGKHKKTK